MLIFFPCLCAVSHFSVSHSCVCVCACAARLLFWGKWIPYRLCFVIKRGCSREKQSYFYGFFLLLLILHLHHHHLHPIFSPFFSLSLSSFSSAFDKSIRANTCLHRNHNSQTLQMCDKRSNSMSIAMKIDEPSTETHTNLAGTARFACSIDNTNGIG